VPERTGEALMARLQNAAEQAGAMVLTQADVTDLDSTPDGRVQAVRYRRPDGAASVVACGALVLASCGFGANRAMVAQHIPSMRDARYFGWEENTGDAIRWGQAMGAALGDMDAYQGLGLLAEPHGIDLNPRLLIEGGIQVNAQGLRFSHELDDVSGQGARVIAQPGGFAWVIYDERIDAACRGLAQYDALVGLGAMRSGDSVAALALACGLPEPELAETLASLERGGDRFGRQFDQPPLRPGFRAIKVTGALFHTQGGLVVDATARVVRRDGQVLPNLFAGGGAARSIGGPGGSGYLPGAGLCMAVTLGRLAGRGAAAVL
jgi:fumarate reductase flavoprotein subunit